MPAIIPKSLEPHATSTRLNALRQYGVLDTASEPSFDDLTELAAAICEVPVAMISLIDRDRQWFKSKLGVLHQESPVEHSVCAHALDCVAMLEIPDTTLDPRTQNNPYMSGPDGYRFYTGAVLRTPAGVAIGTLCILDNRPRQLSDLQRTTLRTLAQQVMAQLELRWLLHDRDRLLEREHEARLQAEMANRVKDEFLATLSHELRTPLNAILGWTQILQTDPGDTQDLADGLATIERNARSQTQIIEDLLDMSRIISGKVQLDAHRIDAADVATQALASCHPAAEAKDIKIITNVDRQAGYIYGDAHRLQQVMWNLLSNAVKFTAAGGTVELSVQRHDKQIEFRVKDSGEGIKPEFLPFVFDRFRQADASTTRQHGGLGLGLSIVKHLVELHGGTVKVSSQGKNHGCTFIVAIPAMKEHLPAAESNSPPTMGRTSAGASNNLTGVSVLVLDDEPDARKLVERVLQGRGAKVTTSSTAQEAFSLLLAHQYDVLVSDIGLTEEDGNSLMQRIRQLPPQRGGQIPAIALTAYARPQDRDRCIDAGFQNHLTKPLDADELLSAISALVPVKA